MIIRIPPPPPAYAEGDTVFYSKHSIYSILYGF